MAIYSFNHDSFGLTTNRPGAAGDNIRYNADLSKTQMDAFLAANARHIAEQWGHRSDAEMGSHLAQLREGRSAAENAAYNAREAACYAVRSHIIPPGPNEAEAWFRAQEQGERKNARMSDRFIGALPRELTPDQCLQAVERFCREVTQDRVPWHFALHLELDQRDQPDWNPHTHIILRDRDVETGRRFLYTSAGAKERAKLTAQGRTYWDTSAFRRKWNDVMNSALERAGLDVRIDHRSLKEQGVDREPQIHVGPASENAERKGYPFRSQDRQRGNRTIPYSLLDQGSRGQYNTTIVEGTEQPTASREHPEQRKLREAQAEVRRATYAEQKRDRDALRQAQKVQLDQHSKWARQLYADARKDAFTQVGEQIAEQWTKVRAIEDPAGRDRAAKTLLLEQKKLYAKTSALHVGQARIEKDQAWQALGADQLGERLGLRAAHRQEYSALIRQQVAERLGFSERRRAKTLQLGANRLASRYSRSFGMAAQQGTAQQAIRLAHRASRDNASINPDDIALTLLKTASAENDTRVQIRTKLNAQRRANELRGASLRGLDIQAGRALQDLHNVLDSDHPARTPQGPMVGRSSPSRGRDRGGGGLGR